MPCLTAIRTCAKAQVLERLGMSIQTKGLNTMSNHMGLVFEPLV